MQPALVESTLSTKATSTTPVSLLQTTISQQQPPPPPKLISQKTDSNDSSAVASDTAAATATALEIESLLKGFFNATSNAKESREVLIDKLLAMCEPDDLVYLSKRIDQFKRDFFALLPLELIERVLVFLDWETILKCCQVKETRFIEIKSSILKLRV